ncbi:MAG TPA: M48 family metalloprotease [Micromonosporaceae bacterium]
MTDTSGTLEIAVAATFAPVATRCARSGPTLGVGQGEPVVTADDLEHPFDQAARARLTSIAGLAEVVARAGRLGHRLAGNRAAWQRVGPHRRPEVYRLLTPICAMLGIDQPDLYLAPDGVGVGGFHHRRPSIVLGERLLATLTPAECQAVLAHECGHLLLGHAELLTVARLLASAPVPSAELSALLFSDDGAPADASAAGAPSSLRAALVAWSHRCELSADRVAALCLDGADPMTRVMFRLAGSLTDPPWYAHHARDGADQAMLAVRVREIEAWVATAGFARLAERVSRSRHPRTSLHPPAELASRL